MVTGASKGIGLAIVSALADEDVYVVAGARDTTDDFDHLVAGGLVQFVRADLATAEGAADLVDAAASRGRINILVKQRRSGDRGWPRSR